MRQPLVTRSQLAVHLPREEVRHFVDEDIDSTRPTPAPATSSATSYRPHHRFFFSYTGDRPRVCLVLCCCLLSFQPRTFEPLYKYRLVGQIPPITPCFADVHRFGRLALLCDDKARYFPAGLPHQAGGVRIPIHLSCRATRRECTGVTSVHQVCHFNLTFGLSGFCTSSPNVHR